jgi:hypothetical protein
MPEYDPQTKEKLAAYEALPLYPGKHITEVVSIYWPGGTRHYCFTQIDQMPGFKSIPLLPIDCRIIPRKGSPFLDLPRYTAGEEATVEVNFCDLDGEFSALLNQHGEGVKAEIFYWLPEVELLLSMWLGHLTVAGDSTRLSVPVGISAGYGDPQALLPGRMHITSCGFIFGGRLLTQQEITFHAGCLYNRHLAEEARGGLPVIGTLDLATGLPYTSCPRAVVGDCFARMTEPGTETQTKKFWPGFDVKPDAIPNNQTRGPNLPASAVGNASNLSDPIRVIAGHRFVKNLPLLASRAEVDTNHPDKGFASGLFEIGEGPLDAFFNFYMNNAYVTAEHSNIRLGDLGQSPTFFSPNVNSFSGTAHAFGRIQGNFNATSAAQLTASGEARGLRNVRVYSDPETYVEQYSTNRADWLLRMRCDARWGEGLDYERHDIASVIETRRWCDENVSMHDPNGDLFIGPRSTFNAELNGRAIRQQMRDLCVAGRIGSPFEFQGKFVFVPLKKETIDDSIPVFTDEGEDRNICLPEGGGALSSLVWSRTSDKALVNQWAVNFDDDSDKGTETQLLFGDEAQQLRAGRAFGDRSVHLVPGSQPAFGSTNFSEAGRLGNLLLYLGPLDEGGIYNNFRVKFTTWWSQALEVMNYKLIRVLNSRLQEKILEYFQSLGLPHFVGVPYEYFRVMRFVRRGNLRVDVEAQVYPTDFYESFEDISTPPPIFVAPPQPNPGGRPGDIPEPILPVGLAHTNDRVVGSFAASVY